MIEAGTVLLGKYRIERLIGEGGMGVVARAHHLHLDQPVAIKLLLPQALDSDQIVQRFLREAQAAVKLRSEHVARVHDVGTLETGAPYMVMELLEGTDLGGLLRQQGRLAPGPVVDLMLQACEALAEAHALGIVHRDIKPANFFITRRAGGASLLKVLDFGISKSPITVDEGLTSTQAVMGTPAYMSPEQMRSSKHVDARTDIWALGVVLYELVTGQRLFAGETYPALCLNVAMEPMPPIDVLLPPGLAEVIARCLKKEPAARFQNMADLAAALAPFAHTPAQATNSVERTAGVFGRAPAPHRAGTDAGPTMNIVGPRRERADAPVTQMPTTLGASLGEVGAAGAAVARGKRTSLMLAAGAAAALATAALVVVLARDGGTTGTGTADAAAGVEAPVRAAAAPAAAAPKQAAGSAHAGHAPAAAEQPDAGAPRAAESESADQTELRVRTAQEAAGHAVGDPASADRAASRRHGVHASDEACEPASSRRSRRARKARADKPAAARSQAPPAEEAAQKTAKDDDTDEIFGTRQ